MEDTTVGVAAAAAALIRPVRQRVVPVAKAVGEMGWNVGATTVSSLGGVLEAVRHPEGDGTTQVDHEDGEDRTQASQTKKRGASERGPNAERAEQQERGEQGEAAEPGKKPGRAGAPARRRAKAEAEPGDRRSRQAGRTSGRRSRATAGADGEPDDEGAEHDA